jgi:hypothetical protein
MQLWMGTEQRIEGFLAEKLGGRAPGFQWFGVLDDDGKEIGGATFTDYNRSGRDAGSRRRPRAASRRWPG